MLIITFITVKVLAGDLSIPSKIKLTNLRVSFGFKRPKVTDFSVSLHLCKTLKNTCLFLVLMNLPLENWKFCTLTVQSFWYNRLFLA